MRNFYFLLSLAGLAACTDSDSPQQGVRSRPSEHVAAVAPAPAAAPAPAPVPAVCSLPAARAGRRPLARRALPQPAGVGKPQVLPVDSAALLTATAQQPTDSLPPGAAKAAQTFWLNPRRDTVLLGAEGTTIWVPAQALVAPTRELGSAELVEFRLQEFYSLPDILLNNLSTNSSQGLLETGGMLHLEARTRAGELCRLRPGTELLIRMPAVRPKADMQLFTGVRTPRHRLDWQRPRKALPISSFQETGPSPAGKVKQLTNVLVRQLAYSAAMAQRIHEGRTRRQRKAFRRSTRFTGKQLVEFGQVALRIDRQGRVLSAAIFGIQDSTLSTRLQQAALQFPSFRPAVLQGPTRPNAATAAPRSYLLSVRKQRPTLAVPLPQLPVAGSWVFEIGFTRAGRVWLPEPGRGSVDNRLGQGPVFEAGEARRRLRQSGAQLQATRLDSLGGYLFSAANLGWANCDRFVNQSGPRLTVRVETAAPDAQVQLVFKRIRAVLPGYGRGSCRFDAIPANEPATIVAFKRENGLTYLATRSIRASTEPERNLEFRPVTPAELRTALAALE
jgi:hypothetical protein